MVLPDDRSQVLERAVAAAAQTQTMGAGGTTRQLVQGGDDCQSAIHLKVMW
jgi:hypothetical protein